MNEFGGEDQFSGIDLNADLPTNESKKSSSSTEVDETIEADQVPGEETGPTETDEHDTEKLAESSPSPSPLRALSTPSKHGGHGTKTL